MRDLNRRKDSTQLTNLDQKRELGQIYTKNARYILGNLANDLPREAIMLIDPFAGEGDLLNAISEARHHRTQFLSFDIDPKLPETERRDTLLDPLDYSGMWVVTNPPYLARNKTSDKRVFDKWSVGDKYKAAIKSIMGCEGGILIVPLNFLCDDKDTQTRVDFLSRYTITGLNIFEERVFDDTDYTVCAFSFVKGGKETMELPARFFPDRGNGNASQLIVVERQHRYRIGGRTLFSKLESNQSNMKISRLVRDVPINGHASNLYLRAIDTGTIDGKIRLERVAQPYYGDPGDKSFASFVFDAALTNNHERHIVESFNSQLNRDREMFHSLFLTNYRTSTTSYARKRISFNLAYRYISYILRTELGFS